MWKSVLELEKQWLQWIDFVVSDVTCDLLGLHTCVLQGY